MHTFSSFAAGKEGENEEGEEEVGRNNSAREEEGAMRMMARNESGSDLSKREGSEYMLLDVAYGENSSNTPQRQLSEEASNDDSTRENTPRTAAPAPSFVMPVTATTTTTTTPRSAATPKTTTTTATRTAAKSPSSAPPASMTAIDSNNNSANAVQRNNSAFMYYNNNNDDSLYGSAQYMDKYNNNGSFGEGSANSMYGTGQWQNDGGASSNNALTKSNSASYAMEKMSYDSARNIYNNNNNREDNQRYNGSARPLPTTSPSSLRPLGGGSASQLPRLGSTLSNGSTGSTDSRPNLARERRERRAIESDVKHGPPPAWLERHNSANQLK